MTVRRAGEFRRFEFRPIEALPRLAWCARLTRNHPTVVVEHGPWVETFPGGFVEGAWNGSFAGKDFAGADVFSACTVLDEVIGCTQAVTFPEARTEHNPSRLSDSNDSGAEIGRYLGVDVTSFVREEYLGRQDFPEAEFLATGNGGDDVVMSALERGLPRTMLITGFLGDTLWGIGGQDPRESRYYRYGFPAGASLAEFRLRLGFIHAPVPLFTFPPHPDVDSITRSREMEPWRVGGPYDRPIPRRLSSRAESRARCLGKRTRLLHSPSGLHRRSRAFCQIGPSRR